MLTPPASSHGANPTLGSEPQQVPNPIVGRFTPGAISTVLPSGLAAAERPAEKQEERNTPRIVVVWNMSVGLLKEAAEVRVSGFA
jgi:hypothetical protein